MFIPYNSFGIGQYKKLIYLKKIFIETVFACILKIKKAITVYFYTVSLKNKII